MNIGNIDNIDNKENIDNKKISCMSRYPTIYNNTMERKTKLFFFQELIKV